jgi:hypothetical protein
MSLWDLVTGTHRDRTREIYRRDEATGQKIKINQKFNKEKNTWEVVKEEPIKGDYGYEGFEKRTRPKNAPDNKPNKPGGSIPPSKPAPKPTPPPPPKAQAKADFNGPLRYPREAIPEGQDYIRFNIHTYKRGGVITRDDKTLADKLLGTIILPIPSQISDSNVANFGSGNMNFAEEKIFGAAESGISGDLMGMATQALDLAGQVASSGLVKKYFASQATKSLGSNISLEQILARTTGSIINPNMELLFNGPGLRQFKFSFRFTPRDEKESLEVKKIIKAFKRNMAPQGSGGGFLKTPNIFQINYMQGKGVHPYLNKFKLCALTNMSVNYTGDGVHATYWDGTPISMQMDLSFSELTPIYNEDYNEIEKFGDGHEGVGY